MVEELLSDKITKMLRNNPGLTMDELISSFPRYKTDEITREIKAMMDNTDIYLVTAMVIGETEDYLLSKRLYLRDTFLFVKDNVTKISHLAV